METTTCRMLLAVLFATATITEAMYIALPRMGRSIMKHSSHGDEGSNKATRTSPQGGEEQTNNTFPPPSVGYIAFPRMGRGYLAFPRLGRSGGGSDAGEDGAACCSTGLKTEWLLAEDGKTTTQNVCAAQSCCQGLQEIMDQKPDGAFYSLCIPSCSADGKLTSSSEAVLRKLKGLLQN